MKPAVYLYGVPGQYENYLAALMARAGSPGSRVNTSGHTAGHSPHWMHVFAWTIACIFRPSFPLICP